MDDSGQALIELLAAILSVAFTVALGGWLLKVEWNRGKCANVVFERTHAQVTHSLPTQVQWGSEVPVHLEDSPTATVGFGICDPSTETVSLPQLDPEVQ